MAHQKVTPDFPTAELPQIGAGKGNRTLVVSLEGIETLCHPNIYSDKYTLFDVNLNEYSALSERKPCRFLYTPKRRSSFAMLVFRLLKRNQANMWSLRQSNYESSGQIWLHPKWRN